jgi:hypothetical protein
MTKSLLPNWRFHRLYCNGIGSINSSQFNYEDDHAEKVYNSEDLLSACPSTSPVPPVADTLCIIGCKDLMKKYVLESRNFVSQNTRGWCSSRKFESIIELMINHNIRFMFSQETWEPKDYIKSVRGHLVLHHNVSSDHWNKTTRKKQGGIRKGVPIIILSPEFAEACKRAGSPPPITTIKESNELVALWLKGRSHKLLQRNQ